MNNSSPVPHVTKAQPPEGKSAPTREFMRRVEGAARAIREKAGVGLRGRFDPFAHAERLGVHIAHPADVGALPEELRRLIAGIDAGVWSGMARALPDGRLLILLNPNQSRERANVTVLEEVAHAYYSHKPTRIAPGVSGLPEREYDPAMEQEAYWTAGAALLPMKEVALAVYRGRTAGELGAAFGASVELAEMRIKTLRLWAPYKANLAHLASPSGVVAPIA